MSQVDTFGIAVRAMLEGWGRTFAIHRDCEYLGHAGVNMLQVLIDHKGEMPAKATGYKPLEINLQHLAVEYAVLAIARTDPTTAWVLRAYYCTQGRRRFERYEAANAMLAKAGLHTLTRASYMDLAESGEARVARILEKEARAA